MTETIPVRGNDARRRTPRAVSAKGFTAYTDAYAGIIDGKYAWNQEHQLWFISLMGPAISVRAIAACLLKQNSEPVYIAPLDESDNGKPTIYTRAADSGKWNSSQIRLPLSRGTHCLAHSAKAKYDNPDSEFMLIAHDLERETEADALNHYRFLNSRLSIPLHPSWANHLWRRALRNEEAVAMETWGMTAWRCKPDEEKLRADLSYEIRNGFLETREEARNGKERE